MSIVACKVYDDRIEIASDSIMVSRYTQSKDGVKLFQNNTLTIGSVGNAEEVSLLRLFTNTTKPFEPTESSILEFLSSFSTWKYSKIGKYGIENSYILIFGGKAFSIEGWLLFEINKYNAIGAGSDYALSALYLEHNVEKAVEVATELSVFCEKPIIKYIIEK